MNLTARRSIIRSFIAAAVAFGLLGSAALASAAAPEPVKPEVHMTRFRLVEPGSEF